MKTRSSSYVVFDPVAELVNDFGREYPHVPVRVQWSYWMPDTGMAALALDQEEGGSAVVFLYLNARESMMSVINAAIECFAAAALWDADSGMPGLDDPRLDGEEHRQRKVSFANAIGRGQRMANIETIGGMQ